MAPLRRRDLPGEINTLTDRILGAAVEVHRQLGPGFREKHYQEALAIEFGLRGIAFEREAAVAAVYKGQPIGQPMRADFIVEGLVILEVKVAEALHPAHEAQAISYLAATGVPVALLVNFHGPTLKGGIRRLVAPQQLPLLRASVQQNAATGAAHEAHGDPSV